MIRKEVSLTLSRETVSGAGKVCRAKRRGMIMVRADLENEKASSAIAGVFAAEIPGVRRIVAGPERELAWMSPDELLGFVPLDAAGDTVRALQDALAGGHFLAADVSSLRTEFQITGAVRDVLAKGTPSDVSPAAFGAGEFRRSRIGQLQAAFWLTGENSARILCRRSEAEFMESWLAAAISPENAPNFFHR